MISYLDNLIKPGFLPVYSYSAILTVLALLLEHKIHDSCNYLYEYFYNKIVRLSISFIKFIFMHLATLLKLYIFFFYLRLFEPTQLQLILANCRVFYIENVLI